MCHHCAQEKRAGSLNQGLERGLNRLTHLEYWKVVRKKLAGSFFAESVDMMSLLSYY